MNGWRWVDPLVEPQWDEWVRAHPHAGPFHASSWARVLADSYRYRLHYGVLDAGGAAPGLVPSCEIDSLFTGRRGSCLPFADACPALPPHHHAGADAGAGAAGAPTVAPAPELLAPLLELGRRRRWRYLELRGNDDPGLPGAAGARYLAHDLELAADDDAQFARLSSHHRRHVRRARRAGVRVRWHSDRAGTDAYYRLHCRTRQRQGVPPQPVRFFRALHEHVIAPGHGTVALASVGGQVVAGAVFLHDERSAIYKYGASLDERREASPNHLIMWEAIRRFAAAGLSSLSFGRTDEGADGLAAFKRGWGASEHGLVYHRIALAPESRPRTLADREPGGLGEMGRRVFQAMPVPLLRLCGALLYRHVG